MSSLVFAQEVATGEEEEVVGVSIGHLRLATGVQ